MERIRISILLCALVISINAVSQTFIGVSLNIGNRIRYTPNSEGLDRPVMLAGSIFFNSRKDLKNNWILLYGANAGIIGYSVKVHSIDTLRPQSTSASIFSFPDYSTFYGGVNAVIGKNLFLQKKKLLLGLGGGASYTYSRYPTEYYVTTHFANGSATEQFYASTSPQNRVTAFAKAVAQLPINQRLTVGLEYSRHFSSILGGHYEFYHTKEPSLGKIDLFQSELSFTCMYRVSKK